VGCTKCFIILTPNNGDPKIMRNKFADLKVAIIGLGYVGLPLATAFCEKFVTHGFDLDEKRIEQLVGGYDRTNEVTSHHLHKALTKMTVSSDIDSLADSNFYIVTVPTPVDEFKVPDLEPLSTACNLLSPFLKAGDFVVFESTVYPGVTDRHCIPLLLNKNDLILNKNLFIGFSPERVNPGDKDRTLANITKIVSGSNEYALNQIESVYTEIIKAGIFKTSSIAVAEAAKVIENIQRDVNIALVNELAMIFDKLGLDTQEVLDAAGSKWNFLKFKPGLVGGHCIGVDPYYLTHRAREVGINPDLVLAGRRINDGMAEYVATKFIYKMISSQQFSFDSKILILGLTFKENCPDMRNSKVFDLYNAVSKVFSNLEIHDPIANPLEVKQIYGITPIEKLTENDYHGVILAVPHLKYINMGPEGIKKLCPTPGILFDLKSIFNVDQSDLRL
jgi:UDP-N-acetyl-D-glucosamine/UDP-N-acetyl-D-galactosamine dehydrogenase